MLDQIEIATGVVPERVGGASRCGTAALVAERFFPTATPTAYVATGESFPDALGGHAAAARRRSPVLLSPSTVLAGPGRLIGR